MSESLIYRLVHLTARGLALAAVKAAPDGWVVRITPPTRSLDQNRLLWPILTTLSKRVLWDGDRLSADEWKDLLTASLRKQKVVRGVDGGLVFLGLHTSSMDKGEFSDLLDLSLAFAAERGVALADPRKVAA